METFFQVGWFITMPHDQKKQTKTTIRWVTVESWWLKISPKPNEDPIITINLGFCLFTPVKVDDNILSTSIEIKTGCIQGNLSLVLLTNSRYELLDLNDALVKGKNEWITFVRRPLNEINIQGSFREKKKSFIGSKMLNCQISPEGFKTSRSTLDSCITYHFNQISCVYPSFFDKFQGTCFDIIFKNPQNVSKSSQQTEMTLQCHNFQEMIKFITSFQYFLAHEDENNLFLPLFNDEILKLNSTENSLTQNYDPNSETQPQQ